MPSRNSRRSVVAIAAAAPVMFRASASAQTPAANLEADLFTGFEFTPGEIDTPFGVVQFPENPQRIVVIDDGPLDAILALGVEPIGYTMSSNGETASAYLADRVPAISKPVGGWGELDIEEVILLEPDLIIDSRWQSEDIVGTLSLIAPVIIPVTTPATDADGLQEWEQELLGIGHVLGMLEEAKSVVLESRARAAQLQVAVGDKAGQSVVVFRPQPEFPVVMSHSWITGRVLTWCGFRGNELTESAEPPHTGDSVSLERLDLLEADWLFAAARTSEMATELDNYLSNPGFQMITAVKDGHVELVAGDLWSGTIGVLATHAMMDDIERILVNGE